MAVGGGQARGNVKSKCARRWGQDGQEPVCSKSSRKGVGEESRNSKYKESEEERETTSLWPGQCFDSSLLCSGVCALRRHPWPNWHFVFSNEGVTLGTKFFRHVHSYLQAEFKGL